MAQIPLQLPPDRVPSPHPSIHLQPIQSPILQPQASTINNHNEIKSVLSAKLPEIQKLRGENNWST